MACGGCLQMRHAMIRLVLGPRIADKFVPSQVKIAPPLGAKDARPAETVVRRNVVIKAKRG
jgi:hypothetical protein